MARGKSRKTLRKPGAGGRKAAKGDSPADRVALEGRSNASSWNRHAVLLALALVIVTVAVYLPVRGYGFLDLDDPQYVSENPIIAKGLTWDGIVWAFTSIHASYWIPILSLSHMLDVQLFGLNAGGHHVTNLVLHVANSVLLFALLHRMTSAPYRSALVAVLFALHPQHVESVAWITERKDVLSTLFWLLTTWSYLNYVRRPHGWRYGLIALFFALGLMTKPMLVTLPFVLLLLDVWPLERMNTSGASRAERRTVLRRLVVEKLPLLAMAVLAAGLTYMSQRTTGAVADTSQYPVGLRLQNAVVSYVLYVQKTIWPDRLGLFYPYPESIPVATVVFSAVALIGVTALAVKWFRTHPYLTVGWFWYLGTLVPVIGLVQAGTQARADRFTYVPLVGFFIAVAWLIPQVRNRARFVVGAALVAIVAAFGLRARDQLRLWETKVSLWEHTLAVAGESYDAHINLGIALYEQGRIEPAIGHYREAIRMRSHGAEAYNNLGVALSDKGDVDGAIKAFQDGLAVEPTQVASHFNVAILLAGKGDTAAAIQHLEAALRFDPGSTQVRAELERLRQKEDSR